MRISDWSSDVCSSDLDAQIVLFAHQDVYLPAGWLDRAIEALSKLAARHPGWAVAGPYGVKADGRHVGRVWDATMGRDRKSVVEGKSVSVRVDLGGRRIIKKKKLEHNNQYKTNN